MKLYLPDFFKLIESESYVVIKHSNLLPNYNAGSDIDIFCYHPESISNCIVAFLSNYIDSESTISINDSPTKTHIDFIVDKEIDFRFDVYKKLPFYQNINLKSSYFSSVIESAELKEFAEKCNIKVPDPADDFILRYVEYHEYYAKRPDKIKHIEYIENKFIQGEGIGSYLDKLHYYTDFPTPIFVKKTLKVKWKEKKYYYQGLFIKAKSLYKTAGLKSVILKAFKKIGLF